MWRHVGQHSHGVLIVQRGITGILHIQIHRRHFSHVAVVCVQSIFRCTVRTELVGAEEGNCISQTRLKSLNLKTGVDVVVKHRVGRAEFFQSDGIERGVGDFSRCRWYAGRSGRTVKTVGASRRIKPQVHGSDLVSRIHHVRVKRPGPHTVPVTSVFIRGGYTHPAERTVVAEVDQNSVAIPDRGKRQNDTHAPTYPRRALRAPPFDVFSSLHTDYILEFVPFLIRTESTPRLVHQTNRSPR